MYLAFDDIYINAKYGKFDNGGERAHYRINVGSYPGTVEDSLAYHIITCLLQKTMIMTIWDNCAVYWTGAWWYFRCPKSHLNRQYLGNKSSYGETMWYTFHAKLRPSYKGYQ